jgi:cytochrome c oxidase assembly factor CtaG
MAGTPFILAHQVAGRGPRDLGELLGAWAFEPVTIILLIVSASLYLIGLARTWRAAGGVGRGVRRWEAACFAGGWLALVVALLSPLHAWGGVLFTAHMTQHEILMLVAAPLLVLGRPLVAMLRGMPRSWAANLARLSNGSSWRFWWGAVSDAFAAWIIHFVALWTWHVPALFQATLESDVVHAAQHASFLGSALLFWWAVIHGRHAAASYGLAVLYMLTTAVHSGVLGALLTFARTVWYPVYSNTQSWGMTPLEDQQVGGLVMWVPACLVYVGAGLAFFAGWLRESERRVRLRETKMLHVGAAEAAPT